MVRHLGRWRERRWLQPRGVTRGQEIHDERRYAASCAEPFTLSGLPAEQYRALLDEYGLKASARRVNVGTAADPVDIEVIVEENRVLGIRYFGSGGTPSHATEAEWVAYAEYLDEIVGEGLIDFPSIFAAGGGCVRYFVVEHDPRFGHATFDPFEAAEAGFDHQSCVTC